MKKIIVYLGAVFNITTASATVYEGTYTGGTITISQDSLFEENSVFDNTKIFIKKDNNLIISDNVQITNNSHIEPYSDIYGHLSFNMLIDGDNVIFQNNAQTAIIAGISGDYQGFDNRYIGNINISINGNGTVFKDNVSKHNGSTFFGRGGAIYIGTPLSIYYTYNPIYKQTLTINGTGTAFINNSAHSGGAIYNHMGNVLMNTAVEFSNNNANWDGGAIYNAPGSKKYATGNITISTKSKFIENHASTNGGAIYNESSVSIGADTIFHGNSAGGNGGAIYNDGKNAVIDIDTGNTGVYFETASDSIYNNGGTINFLGTGIVDGRLTSLTSVRGDANPVINLGKASTVFDTVNLRDNTTLKATVWRDGDTVKVGNLSANIFNIQNNDEIKLQIAVENRQVLSMDGAELPILIDLSGSQASGWDLFGDSEKHPIFLMENNLAYDIEFVRDGVYKITPKPFINVDPADGSDIVQNAAMAWNMGGFTENSVAEIIANKMYELSQFADTLPEYNVAIDTISPNADGVIKTLVGRSKNANLRFINRRMKNGTHGFWATGGYSMINYIPNTTEYSGGTITGNIGQDIALSNYFNLGMGFGYTQSSIESDVRQFDLYSPFDMSLYADLNLPIGLTDFYINAILNHSAYTVSENKTVLQYGIESEFDATLTAMQANIGIKRGWFNFDIGVRNNNLMLGSYTDTIDQHIAGNNINTTYALTELIIADTDGNFQWGVNVGGEFAVYGENSYESIITAPNGQRYYNNVNLPKETAITFGGNINIGINDNMSIGLIYDGLISKYYSEHTAKMHFNWAW